MNARELTAVLGGKWKGNRGLALCPCHKEKSPSLNISDGHTKNLVVHCFGCGAGWKEVADKLKQKGIDITDPAKRTHCFLVYKGPKPQPSPEPEIDCAALLQSWQKYTLWPQTLQFAESLGVTAESLRCLGGAWAPTYSAWAFPMCDGNGLTIGIRLRKPDGHKFAVKGSRSGLIMPAECEERQTVFITEGPTDCAAAITLGYVAIGRPSCQGCEDMVVTFLRRIRARRAIIVSDNDAPGRTGAEKLQKMLPVESKIWLPPAKDIREFLRNGGDCATVDALTAGLQWRKPGGRP
jgi:hypothetical protein